ncbi:unnamed protein product [Phaedon cochleariae]|uniref:Fork-head domain-containing protein n=1 Tax=Phaedon cochleariae TaxID=80249 RepID=A0A9P0DP63_PHACE|nr:unnamed protein product [Phaedon cochleariae]
MNNKLIIRNSFDENLTPIKIEYFDPTDSGRVVSQTFRHSVGQPPSKIRKITCNLASSFPKIAIKKENDLKYVPDGEVLLVNGCWDTTNKIPNIVAEMHNVKSEDFRTLHNGDIINDSPRDLKSPSPRGSDSGIESDCTDGNLSWLLNYRIHELPPVPDVSASENSQMTEIDAGNQLQQTLLHEVPRIENSLSNQSNKSSQAHSYRYSGPKKPPFTYTELIEYALGEKGELTVSGIYQWISDHFPFYKQNDDRWKNSVRHNLSINPHFRKGGKAVQGAGHLWTIAQRDDKKTWQIRQRMNQFIQNTQNDTKTQEQEAFDKELQAATESILGEINNQTKVETVKTTYRRDNNIEIQYINLAEPTINGLEDFLAPPVSKQEIVNECGLGNDFFITDINPNVLGLNLVESESTADAYEDVFEYYGVKE